MAKRKAESTFGPMPGTLRWIMKGTTLMEAPNMEQIPVAVKDKRPIFRESRLDESDKFLGLVFVVVKIQFNLRF